MNLIVLTPEKEIFNGEVERVNAPGTSGQFEILQGHAPIVSSLGHGNVKITSKSGEEITFSISRGFIEVLRNDISLLVQGYKED